MLKLDKFLYCSELISEYFGLWNYGIALDVDGNRAVCGDLAVELGLIFGDMASAGGLK